MREIAITIYLFIFHIIFNLFKLFPLQQKTTFVASFGRNILYTLTEVEKQTADKIVIIKTYPCNIKFKRLNHRRVLLLKRINILNWVESIYHLATSKIIFVDNYFGFLAVTSFKPEVLCIQLWHAAGAIKQFGLQDLSIQNRPANAFKRFRAVYKRFDYIVIGSDKMGAIFQEGFAIKKSQLLKTGIPRTDFFFNEEKKNLARESIGNYLPVINEKKVILYSPTYRDSEMHMNNIQLDIDKMYSYLKNEYVLLLSFHPTIKVELDNNYPGFVYDVTPYNINHMLIVTDILITDYSSIPFEFSLLHKPMIFFAYDIESYTNERGFWENYEDLVPGPVVQTTEEIIDLICKNNFDMKNINDFSNEWNRYSKGHSSENLVNAIYRHQNDRTHLH